MTAVPDSAHGIWMHVWHVWAYALSGASLAPKSAVLFGDGARPPEPPPPYVTDSRLPHRRVRAVVHVVMSG